MRTFRGRWQLSPLGPDACRVEYRMTVAPRVRIPGPVLSRVQSVFMAQVRISRSHAMRASTFHAGVCLT